MQKYKSVPIKDANEEMVLGVLFGLDLEDNYDLGDWNEEYQEDMIENTIIIGADYGSGLLVLINQEEEKGIYYWDNALELESSSEEENTYKLSDSFGQFIKML
ncbi:SMI1/KNR4 family protein [Scopulibacillus daqui]|uniref:SMI1/KNR4 family protein n=1 Tax=Scopulibacillus daqui TaxID=1469162 RepID=UPI0019606595|nr:SMI1/KNR4 family protein [Scopulibacillus daqui]